MSDTPIYDGIIANHKALMQKGVRAGLEQALEYAKSIAKPTKQVQELTHWLEAQIEQA